MATDDSKETTGSEGATTEPTAGSKTEPTTKPAEASGDAGETKPAAKPDGDSSTTDVDTEKGMTEKATMELLKEIHSTLDSEIGKTEKALGPPQVMGLLKKIHSMLAPHFKSGAATSKKEDQPKAQDTKKTLLQLTDDGNVTLNPDALRVIAKAKQFTGPRMEKLTTAVSALIDMVKEVSPEAASQLSETLTEATAAKPTEKAAAPAATGEASDIGTIVTDAVQKAVKPVDERLQKLENVRGTPKSTESQETTETPVEKGQGDGAFWGSTFR